MLGSTIVEMNGVFLGVAILVSASGARRFHAVHDSAKALHNETLADLAELRRRLALVIR